MGEPAGHLATLGAVARARNELVHELHDLVTQRVAAVSLQVMGHRLDRDPDRLQATLEVIAGAAAEVTSHLWVMERVLRSPAEDLGPSTGLARLTVGAPLPTLVRRCETTLLESGFGVTVTVTGEEQLGRVRALHRRTLEAALEAATDVVVDEASRGTPCRVEVSASPSMVTLRVSAQVPRAAGERVGAGIAGLRERVRLVGGAMWAGHQAPGADEWTLDVRLRDR